MAVSTFGRRSSFSNRSSTDIGARLDISYKTVQTHRARLLKKLKLTNTFQLSRYPIEHKADRLLPVPAQPTPPPMLPAPMPIVHRSHSVEREEWPVKTTEGGARGTT
jgi:hypothetical protein